MPDIRFSEDALAEIRRVMARYPEGRHKSAILAVLHLAQKELGGYLSPEVMDYVASILKIQPIEVYEVATFYTMFYLKPVGKHVLELCRTGPCCLTGSERILACLERNLGIKEGETTPDGMFTLKTVECLASCGSGPVMQVGDRYFEHLDEQRIGVILDALRRGQVTEKLYKSEQDRSP